MGYYDNRKELYRIVPSDTNSRSSMSSFCKVLAYITWIGGLIVAISSSTVTVSGYYRDETSFNFGVFMLYAIIFGISGGMMMCLAELLENVHSIAASLRALRVMRESSGSDAAAFTQAPSAVPAQRVDPISTTPAAQPAPSTPEEDVGQAKASHSGNYPQAFVTSLLEGAERCTSCSEMIDLIASSDFGEEAAEDKAALANRLKELSNMEKFYGFGAIKSDAIKTIRKQLGF